MVELTELERSGIQGIFNYVRTLSPTWATLDLFKKKKVGKSMKNLWLSSNYRGFSGDNLMMRVKCQKHFSASRYSEVA